MAPVRTIFDFTKSGPGYKVGEPATSTEPTSDTSDQAGGKDAKASQAKAKHEPLDITQDGSSFKSNIRLIKGGNVDNGNKIDGATHGKINQHGSKFKSAIEGEENVTVAEGNRVSGAVHNKPENDTEDSEQKEE